MRLVHQQSFLGGPMAGKPRKRHAVVQPLDQSYRYIALTRNQNAIVDAEDFEWLNQFNWHARWCKTTKSFYATRAVAGPKNGPRQIGVHMHDEILGCRQGEEADHKNHDTLDNRRENLRKCTRFQNIRNGRIHKDNKSGFKGVDWHEGKWRARITINYATKYIGAFDSPEEAALAYDCAAMEYFGRFALLNFS